MSLISQDFLAGRPGCAGLVFRFHQCGAGGYTDSDQKVSESINKIVAESDGRVIVALFASNVFRIQQIINIALHHHRKIVFNGRSIEQTVAVARELGYLRFPDNMCLDVKQVNSYPDAEIVVITTEVKGNPCRPWPACPPDFINR